MYPKISAYAGIIISILMIAAGIFFSPHFVANHISSDGIITESGTILMINGYRLSMVLIGISMLMAGIIRPDFIYSATNALVQRSLKERTEQITHKTGAFSNKVLSILFCIIVLGSLLRFYGLDKQSFWNDEVASEVSSNQENLTEVIDSGVRPDVHPPGFHILLYFVEKYIGNSESALRFPSAIAGILSILVIFLLGTRLYSYKEGIISSILIALLWCPIYYSQEARAYSLMLLFTLLATYFWLLIIEALDEEPKLPIYSITGYIISSIILCYLHYFGLYLIALQGFFASLYFLLKRKKLIQIIFLYFIIASSYIPFLPIFWEQLHRAAVWIPKPTIAAFLYYLKFLFNNSFVLLSIVLILFFILLYVDIILFAQLKNDRKKRASVLSSDVFLLLWLVVPFSGIFIKSIFSSSLYSDRNLIISLPAAYLLLSRSITQFNLSSVKFTATSLVITCFLLFHLIYSMNYYSKPHKEQFREAADYIVEKDQAYKNSLIVGWAWSKSYFDYYFQRMGFNGKVDILAGEKNDISPLYNEIRLKCPEYIWYISAHRVPDNLFVNSLNKELTLVDQKQFLGAKVWLFKNKILCKSP
jgi:mannosyltransferase